MTGARISDIGRIVLAACAVALGGCGKKTPPAPPASLETPEYRAWKGGQFLRQLPAAAGAQTVSGRIEVLPPEQRAKNPEDFCELYLNGFPVYRLRVARMADGRWPKGEIPSTFMAGPNWIDLWDSTTNRNYRQQIDTRSGADFVCSPTAEGYEIQQFKRE